MAQIGFELAIVYMRNQDKLNLLSGSEVRTKQCCLISLMDLLKKYAAEYFEIAKGTERLIGIVSKAHNIEYPEHRLHIRGTIGERLERIKRACKAINLPASSAQVRRILSQLHYDTPEGIVDVAKTMYNDLIDLQQRMEDELQSRYFFHVNSQAIQYYSKNQFPRQVQKAFPEDYDMRHAGRCFAFGLYTGCACHLMRVAELGLTKVEKEYGLPKARSWGKWLINLHGFAKGIEDAGDVARKKRIMAIHVRVLGIKDAWRDNTMHVVRKYDEEEAKEVFGAVKNFMIVVSGKLP